MLKQSLSLYSVSGIQLLRTLLLRNLLSRTLLSRTLLSRTLLSQFRMSLGLAMVLVFSLMVNVQAAATSTAEPQLPETLTKESVSGFLAELSDKEVRSLLNKQLQGLAEKSAEGKQSLSEGFTSGIINTRDHLHNAIQRLLDLPQSLSVVGNELGDAFGDFFAVIWFAGLVAMILAAAYVVAVIALRILPARYRLPEDDGSIVPFAVKLKLLGRQFVLANIGLLIFYSLAETLIMLSVSNSTAMMTAVAILDYVYIARVAYVLMSVFLAPCHGHLRMINLPDRDASRMVYQGVVLALLATSSIVLEWSWHLGLKPFEAGLGFWLEFCFYLALLWIVWSNRQTFTAMLLLQNEQSSPSRIRFAEFWPKVVMIAVVLTWVSLQVIIANGGFSLEVIYAAVVTLVIFLVVPFFDVAIRAMIESLYPLHLNDSAEESESEAVIDGADADVDDTEADNETAEESWAQEAMMRGEVQVSALRVTRFLLASLILIILPLLWGVSYVDLASQGISARIAASLVESTVLLLLAMIAAQVIDVLVKRKLAMELPSGGDEHDSEGGQGLSRAATLLPIVRIIAFVLIFVSSLFAILSSLGVNTTPLLAGAGVVGLAIGFGAQTLVKDIVSGMFFLIDDAFRMGEYVDVGEIKGTVEKIALRSLRLRHHLGALHTVPYGDIARLTNYSRDWVIMKLRFRVPHDTDINKVKKLFKNLGKELLNDPVIGKDFIEPFKSQGVLEVDEVGMVIRGKFTCKPGGQFMIRKEVYAQVQRIFAENGIEFARRKVEVQMPEHATEQDRERAVAAASEAIQSSQSADAAKPA
ncbi:mechanosensitive ion channel family protein [Aliamphritea ceti]|uniref:mechanosensitive ion channel family protein n=1 Tax=Aliamphritea ceti TaxID=1524258 RepID=UPI0021C4BC10|nr:mechanosensitive ion channel family protein [Aliamphritea ceti]